MLEERGHHILCTKIRVEVADDDSHKKDVFFLLLSVPIVRESGLCHRLWWRLLATGGKQRLAAAWRATGNGGVEWIKEWWEKKGESNNLEKWWIFLPSSNRCATFANNFPTLFSGAGQFDEEKEGRYTLFEENFTWFLSRGSEVKNMGNDDSTTQEVH